MIYDELEDTIATAAETGSSLAVHGDSGWSKQSWSDLHRAAEHIATNLRRKSSTPHLIAFEGKTSRGLLLAIRAALNAGYPFTVLRPADSPRSEELEHREAERLGASLVVGATSSPHGWPPRVSLDRFLSCDFHLSSEPVWAEGTAFVQRSSGTTGSRTSVSVGRDQLVRHIRSIESGLDAEPSDRVISWLPLSHDMGLVGAFLAPMISGFSAMLCPTEAFLNRPGKWMAWSSEYRASILVAPSFAYRIASRTLNSARDIDLSCVRCCLNGSEPVRRRDVESFLESGQIFGLRASSMMPVYGLAEAILGVAFSPVGRGAVFDRSTPEANGIRAEYALLGPPLPGLEARIGGDDVKAAIDRTEVGALMIRGDSVVGQRDAEGWLDTGDVAYLHSDEVVVCGREKDVLNVGGINYFAEDIEAELVTAGLAHGGRIAVIPAVSNGGREAVGIVLEGAAEPKEVRRALRAAFGIRSFVMWQVDAGAIPRTSSGKVQRFAARELVMSTSPTPG